MYFHELNAQWLDALQRRCEPAALQQAQQDTQHFLLAHGAGSEPYLPLPLLIDQSQFEAIAAAGRSLLQAQGKILRHLEKSVGRAGLIELFEVPELMQALVDWDNLIEGRNLVVRFDVVPSSQGYQFCEINCDTTVAGFELHDCQRVFDQAMGWQLAERQASTQGDIAQLLRRLARERGFRRVLVCDWSRYRDSGCFGFSYLGEALQRALPELEVRVAYEDEHPEDWLQPGQATDLLVYRGFMYGDMDDGGRFARRLQDSGATLINSFETEIRSNKLWFALLHDARYRRLLDASELLAIDRFVPRTVALNAANAEAVLAAKDAYVFKLNSSNGGRGVFFGSELSQEQLRERLEGQGGVERWTAQLPIESSTLALPQGEAQAQPHRLVLGLFMVDGQASGVNVRASHQSRIVNVSLGVASCLWASPVSPDEFQSLLQSLEPARSTLQAEAALG